MSYASFENCITYTENAQNLITAEKQRKLGGDTKEKTWHGMIDF